MRLFKSGKIYNFMAVRWYWIGLSLVITIGAAILLLLGKARLGTDFTGGTEVEIAFKRPVTAGDLRTAVVKTGNVSQVLQRSGTIEPVAQATVAFPISGTISSVSVQPGESRLPNSTVASLSRTLHAVRGGYADEACSTSPKARSTSCCGPASVR